MGDNWEEKRSFTAVVDHVNENGEAIIDMGGGETINLGPLDESVVGEEVEFKLQASGGGKCLNEEYKLDREELREYIRNQDQKETSSNLGSLESGSESSETSPSDPVNKNELLSGDM